MPLPNRLIPFGQIASVTLGLTPAGRDALLSDLIRVVQVGDLIEESNEVRPLEELNQVQVNSGLSLHRYRVECGDLLVSCKGTLGKVAMVGGATEGAVATSNLLIVRPSLGVRPSTVLAILKSERAQQHFRSRARGSINQVMSFRDLDSMEIPDPAGLPVELLDELLEAHATYMKATKKALEAKNNLTKRLIEQAVWG